MTVAFLALKGPKESVAFLGPTDLQDLRDLQESWAEMASRAYLAPMAHQERKALEATRAT